MSRREWVEVIAVVVPLFTAIGFVVYFILRSQL